MSINDISNNGVNGTGFSNDEGSSSGRDAIEDVTVQEVEQEQV